MKPQQIARRLLRLAPALGLSAVLVFGALAGRSEAGLAIQVLNASARPGGAGAFDVLLVNESGSHAISGFSVQIAVARGSGVEFRGVSVDVVAAPYIFGTQQTPPLSFDDFPNVEFLASDSLYEDPNEITLDQPGQAVGLLRVSFAVSAGAAVGVVPVSIVLGDGTQINQIAGEPLAFRAINGAITIQGGAAGVPEPASLIALATAATLWPLSLWAARRRRPTDSSTPRPPRRRFRL